MRYYVSLFVLRKGAYYKTIQLQSNSALLARFAEYPNVEEAEGEV